MSVLFALNSIPTQLQHLQDVLTADLFEQGFRELGFKKGSPGYKAIENPVTPVDKAFQIYALHLAHSSGFKHESTDHTTMWQRRDAAWKAGADWLMETQDVYKALDKKETRELAKILPEALRCQCSLELPPGPWADFPRDGMKKSKDMDKAMDTLQRMGLNIKIHGIAILEGESPKPEWRLQEDQGTLAAMVQSVQAHKMEQTKRTAPTSPANPTLDLF